MKPEKQPPILTLKQIQDDFVAQICHPQKQAIASYLKQNPTDSTFRLDIYRNNIMQNLRDALEKIFFNIWQLIGKECADNLAYVFCQTLEHLPVTHCLDDWGSQFPLFLQKNKHLKPLVYLKDIAKLEWLQHKSYRACTFKALDPFILQKKLHHDIEQIGWVFNPSVYLFSSFYGLKDIIDLINDPQKTDHVIFYKEPCYAVISRPFNHVVTYWLSESQFYFLKLLKKGFSLPQSFECVLKKDHAFDLVECLQIVLTNRLLWKVKKIARLG